MKTQKQNNVKVIENEGSHIGLEDYVNTRFFLFFEEVDFNRLNFLDSLSKSIKALKKEGLQVESIADRLFKVFDEGLERLRNQETEQVWDFMKTVSQKTLFDKMEEEVKYQWRLEEGAKHCDDCLAREGKTLTFAEWDALGLPGSGVTKCGYNCLCDLIEVIQYNTRTKKV